MIIFKLLCVFLLVMAITSMKKPIYMAVAAGAAATWLLYGIPLADGLAGIVKACTSWSTLSLLLVIYIITFLKKMMGKSAAPSSGRSRA